MRSMRLFFTASDATSGQFVITTWDAHYKIFHFHHGGLDKLAQLLEQWNVVKTKCVKDASFCHSLDNTKTCGKFKKLA